MVWKLTTIIVFISQLTLTLSSSAKLTLYGQGLSEPIVISGSDCPYGVTLDADSSDFSCACMKGLWALYENTCSPPTLVTGGIEEKCVQLKHKVRKVHLLSSPEGGVDSATVFSDDMKTTKARIEMTGSIKHDGSVKVVATGTKSWGLKELGSCLAPEIPDETLFGSSPQFCTFAYNATKGTMLDPTCDDGSATTISPTKCVPFLEGSLDCASLSPPVAPKGRAMKAASPKKVATPVAPKGRTSKAVPPAKKPTTPAKKTAIPVAPKGRTTKVVPPVKKPSAVIPPKGRATKAVVPAKKTVAPKGRSGKPAAKGRSTKTAPKSKAIKKTKGRVFLETVTGLGNQSVNASTLSNSDIDKNLTLNVTNPVMNSELFNYLTARAQSMLNLSLDAKTMPLTPSFRFLDLAKQVLQKACPESYVATEHFNMALGTFTQLQTKHLNYKDTFADYATGLRIEESLKFCRDNMTVYPFVDPKNRTKETCNKTIEMGTFTAFGNMSEMILPFSSASRENEPIVETVWKIFSHAHAACYNHFAEGFNDHHRFTSVLLPLFTNQINEIWNSIKEVKPDTYNGLLGDAVKLMDGVAYCADFSRLDTPYPWDLPRPARNPQNIGRKRRAAPSNNGKFTCLKKSFDNKC